MNSGAVDGEKAKCVRACACSLDEAKIIDRPVTEYEPHLISRHRSATLNIDCIANVDSVAVAERRAVLIGCRA